MNPEERREPPSGLLRADDAARYLACSASTLKRLVQSGCIPKTRISRRVVRFRVVDLDAYVARASSCGIERVPWPTPLRRSR